MISIPDREDLPEEIDEIRDELDRILSSPNFNASKRRMEFLRFVVDQALSGHAETIKAYTIAVSVFGRGSDFNPQIDPIVSVEAGRLRRALEYYYLTDGRNNPLRIEIPKGQFVPRFSKNRDFGATGEETPGKGVQQPDSYPSIPSVDKPGVAVIVFRNLSFSKDLDFYAAGFSTQIVANLYQYKNVSVVGPLPGETPGGQNLDLIDIGKKHDVHFILSGSVQPRGESIRVTAWLKDVRNEENVWIEQFDEDLTVNGLYKIEDEITQRIVGTLADQIGVITRLLVSRTKDRHFSELTAYEATLKMYHWGIVLTEEAFFEAWRALEHAVETSPNHALSRAMLANVYASDYLSEIGLVKNRMKRAEGLAREAVALDPQCVDARWVMGFIHFLKRDAADFVKEFEAALRLNPNNPTILAIYGLFLPGIGEWEKALDLTRKARKLNPNLSSQYYLPTALNYCRKGLYEQAYTESLNIETPGSFWGPLVRAAFLGQMGKAEEAKPHLNRLMRIQPSFHRKGRELIQRLLYSVENVDMIYEGLLKSGFSDSSNDSFPSAGLGERKRRK